MSTIKPGVGNDAFANMNIDAKQGDPAAKPKGKETRGAPEQGATAEPAASSTPGSAVSSASGISALQKTDALAASKASPVSWITNAAAGAISAGAPSQSNEQLKALFAPLVASLAEPQAPGGKFEVRDALREEPLSLTTLPFAPAAFHLQANEQPAAPSTAPARVRVVLGYQALTEKLFATPQFEAMQTRLATLSPAAQKLLAESSATIANVAAAFRSQEPGLWRAKNEKDGELRGAALRDKLDRLFGELDPGPGRRVKDTDIEIPGLDVVKSEELGALVHSAGASVAQTIARVHREESGLAHIDWASASVESLLMLVMMNGFKAEQDATRELLRDMARAQRSQDSLRAQLTAAKQSQTALERKLREEFAELQGTGVISREQSFDNYAAWRQLDFAALQETLGADGQRDYTLATPRLSPLDPSEIPDWLRTSQVPAAGVGSQTSPARAFGLPAAALDKLKEVFTALDIGLGFTEWLQSDAVGLTTVASLDDIAANLQRAKSALATLGEPGGVEALWETQAVTELDREKLDKAQQAFLEFAKAKLVHQAFSGTTDQAKVQQLEVAYERSTEGLDAATAQELNRWLDDEGTDAVEAFVADELNPLLRGLRDDHAFWTEGDPNRREGTGGWDQRAWEYSFGSGKGRGGPRTISIDASQDPPSVSINKVVTANMLGAKRDEHDQGIDQLVIGATGVFDAIKGGAQNQERPNMVYLVDTPYQGAKPQEVLELLAKLMPSGPNRTVELKWQGSDLRQEDATAIARGAARAGFVATTADGGRAAKAQRAREAIGEAIAALTALGDPRSPTSELGRWAREQGFDLAWNAEQAAQRGPRTSGGAATPPCPRPTPTDPHTGIPLNLRGNLAEFGARVLGLQDKLDTLKSFGETDQLRLQMQMERQSKLLTTLSNIMKKIDDTTSAIAGNLK